LIAIGGGGASASAHALTDHLDVFVRRLARDAAASQVEKGGAVAMDGKHTGIRVEVPGREPLVLTQLLLDFTGTLSCDGVLVPGVSQRIEKLGQELRITVLTADTFGRAAEQLAGLPVELRLVSTGQDKVDFLARLNKSETAAVGNGRNDIGMVRGAALGIAVIGPEACAAELIEAAEVVCCDILAALDLLLNPLRITATLRA
jgi:soluble P-type ATPase